MVEIDDKQLFSIVQKAKETGSLRIGANEVTKAVERGQAKLVLTATDVSPAEIVAHFPGLCKEMNILCFNIGNRAELGALVGIKSTTAVAVADAGSAKKELEALVKSSKEEKVAPKEEEALAVEKTTEQPVQEAKAE